MPPPPPRKSLFRPSFGGVRPPSSIVQNILANAPPSFTSRTGNPAHSHCQAQSPLVSTFPYDIRHLIYLEILGGNPQQVHLVQRAKSINAIQCWMPDAKGRHGCLGTAMATGLFIGWLSPSTDYGDSGMPAGRMRRVGMRVLELAYTCQRIYDEVIPLLYTLPTFLVDNICTLPWWKDTLPPNCFDSVRSLSMKFSLLPTREDPEFVRDPNSKFSSNAASKLADDMWQRTWSIVSQMKGLRRLQVILDAPGPVVAEMEAEVLEPLRKIMGLDDYEVAIGWDTQSKELLEDDTCEIPFRLVR